MTVTHVDSFQKAVEQAETKHGLQWNYGMKEQFLKDLKREVESVGGRFRNKSGASIDIENYIAQKLSMGIYVRTRPGVKEKYVGPFKYRDEETKRSHANFTKYSLEKALKQEGIVFQESYKDKAFELIANNFLVGDDENGLAFSRIIDSEIGAIGTNERYYLNPKHDSKKPEREQLKDLLNHLQIGKWIDWDATKISQLQHKAALRQTASNMVPVGSKPAEIEKIVEDLEKFERRSLRTGKALPAFNKTQIDEEFAKFRTLNGQAVSGSNTSVNKPVDDFSDLVSETRRVVVQPQISQHEGF